MKEATLTDKAREFLRKSDAAGGVLRDMSREMWLTALLEEVREEALEAAAAVARANGGSKAVQDRILALALNGDIPSK